MVFVFSVSVIFIKVLLEESSEGRILCIVFVLLFLNCMLD